MPGENPGILPGDLEEKLEPYMYSFYGNLDKIFGLKLIRKELIRREFIEVQCLGFVRGVTIDNAIVIIDEVQNLSVHSFKTILSRIGKNCKMILLGDLEQIDLRNRSESGLKKVMDSLKNNPNIDLIEFSKEEIVRNPIIEGILKDLENI
jgi:phosphate starvation-inducible PhoH-like protein